MSPCRSDCIIHPVLVAWRAVSTGPNRNWEKGRSGILVLRKNGRRWEDWLPPLLPIATSYLEAPGLRVRTFGIPAQPLARKAVAFGLPGATRRVYSACCLPLTPLLLSVSIDFPRCCLLYGEFHRYSPSYTLRFRRIRPVLF